MGQNVVKASCVQFWITNRGGFLWYNWGDMWCIAIEAICTQQEEQKEKVGGEGEEQEEGEAEVLDDYETDE